MRHHIRRKLLFEYKPFLSLIRVQHLIVTYTVSIEINQMNTQCLEIAVKQLLMTENNTMHAAPSYYNRSKATFRCK